MRGDTDAIVSGAVDPSIQGLRAELQEGLQALRIAPEMRLVEELLGYLALLAHWNRVYNLTSVREPRDMLVRHVFDSLVVAEHLQEGALADLGSGAGLPGIPLALLDRSRTVTLVESSGKKARFLRTVVRELALEHVEIHAGRAESAKVARKPLVIARALAPLADLAVLAEPWLQPGGELLAMKGPGFESELASVPSDFVTAACHRLHVPNLDAERYLVVLKRAPPAH